MLVTYIIGSLALIVKPGPDLMCTLSTALSEGKTRAIVLMAGLILGCWLWILLLAAGVASFFTHHPRVMTAIQCAGIAFIGYLAAVALRDAWRSRHGRAQSLHPAMDRGWHLVLRGVAMSMSNPLTILFFLAFLPNFTHQQAELSPAVQTLLLGTLFCFLVPWIYLPVIFAADALRSRLIDSPRFAAGLKLVSGLMLVGVVVILVLELLNRLGG